MKGEITESFEPLIREAKLACWPVGSVYMSMQATSPAELFGGTWERTAQGRMLIGAGSGTDAQPTPETRTFAAGQKGGEYRHTQTEAELAWHNHEGLYYGDEIPAAFNGGDDTEIYKLEYSYTMGASFAPHDLKTLARGGSMPMNNLPPYIAVYMWRRTA